MSTIKDPSRGFVFLFCLFAAYACTDDTPSLHKHGDAGTSDVDMKESEKHTCAQNEYVKDHACVACTTDFTNAAGDDPLGADTTCVQDVCSVALGVSCSDFEQAYIKASNTDEMDRFGYSVSLYKDTLVVGAPDEDSDATKIDGDQNNGSSEDSGAVYVFTRNDSTWTQQDYIKASNTGAGDLFGSSVSLYENTLVVGAPYEDSDVTGVANDINKDQDNDNAKDSGAVYVFTRDKDSKWVQQAYVKPHYKADSYLFGTSVSLHKNTLAVGAPQASTLPIDKNATQDPPRFNGAVYVFARTDSDWKQQAFLEASNAGKLDQFGTSVCLDENTLAVGAPYEDSKSTEIDGDQNNDDSFNRGAVYVFTQNEDSTWMQQAYIKPKSPINPISNSLFGRAISLHDQTLVVGAPGEDGGTVYVFTRNGSMWMQQADIKASNADKGDAFGTSVSLEQDTLVISATHEKSDATGVDGNQDSFASTQSGAVYVFTRKDSMWTQQAYIKASNTGDGDQFGSSVSLYEGTLVVGAPYEDSDTAGTNQDKQNNNDSEDSGAVYIRKIAP